MVVPNTLSGVKRVKDRCELYSHFLAKALSEVAGRAEPMTPEEIQRLGVEMQANAELQGFLKVHTSGTASALVMGNRIGVALESLKLFPEHADSKELLKYL